MFTVLAAGGYRRNFELLREVCLKLEGVRVEVVAPESWRGLFEDLRNVRFRSGLNDGEFLEAYQGCSCLLQTVENATANNVILEAMACGKPVVAERVGGIPEYVDESCGILVERGDAEGLAAGVMGLRGDRGKRQELGAGARRRAEMLDWENVAGEMRGIYEGL
jgi:glycosyltransferase involved in cell wall biosynthesis